MACKSCLSLVMSVLSVFIASVLPPYSLPLYLSCLSFSVSILPILPVPVHCVMSFLSLLLHVLPVAPHA
jgi:hypothetical protein